MALLHYLNSWVDTVRPNKANIRAGFRDYVVHCLTAADLRATETQGAKWMLVDGAPFYFDAADTISADDGASVVISFDGKRYRRMPAARERLTADRTYYVSPTGSDSALGTSAGRAFATITRALAVVKSLDMNGFDVTIQLADGTYTAGGIADGPFVGGRVTVRGNSAVPLNCRIETASNCIAAVNSAVLTVTGVTLKSLGANGLFAGTNGKIVVGGAVAFDYAAGYHMSAANGGEISVTNDYAVIAGALAHWLAYFGGRISCVGRAVSISFTPAFTYAWAFSSRGGLMECYSCTFTGAATGGRYAADTNAIIFVAGASATYLPGNAAGYTLTGGQYS